MDNVSSSTPWGSRIQYNKAGIKGKSNEAVDKPKTNTVAVGKIIGGKEPPPSQPSTQIKAVSIKKDIGHTVPNSQQPPTKPLVKPLEPIGTKASNLAREKADFPSSQQPQNKSLIKPIGAIESTTSKLAKERAGVEAFLRQFNPPNVNGFDKDGCTPLSKAIAENNSRMVELLVKEYKADVNGVDQEGWTPLANAISKGNLELVKLLVRELKANIYGDSGAGWTPLSHAIAADNLEMVKLLVQELHVDVNRVEGNGWTPLTFAVAKGNLEMVKLLIKELKANVNESDKRGWTPLTKAIEKSNEEMVKLLVNELEANINAIGEKGWTPLLLAVMRGDSSMVKLLVKELKADVNGVNSHGLTPFAIAVSENKQAMVNLLKELGAEKDLELLERKFLANVWGIKGFSELRLGSTDKIIKLEYEGLTNYYSLKILREYAHAFFAKPSSIPKEVKDQIISAMDQGFPLSQNSAEMAARVKSGKPLIINAGISGHAISFVLFKGQLVICNRGEGRKGNAVEFFSLPSDKVSEEIINKLKATYPDINSFNQMLEDLIKDLNLTHLGGYHQKDQKIGNCAWSSPKAAVGALFYLYLGQQKLRPLYKEFTGFTRERSLSDYIQKSQKSTSRDTKLLQAIEEKKKAKLQNRRT